MSGEVGGDVSETTLEGGSYEVIRQRLLEQARALGQKADALNQARIDKFGGVALEVIANERVRTENNCVPRDIVNVGGTLLFAYNVFIGLRTETNVADVFALHAFSPTDEGGFDLSALPADSVAQLLTNETFVAEFEELYRYYRDATLLQVRRTAGKLLAVFKVGNNLDDIKAFRWLVNPEERVEYVDNRGERDHTFPSPHDFEWTVTGREDQVRGRHPHVNILDEVFVEMVGGDLTVKVEDNTEDGMGIYREPVQDARQSLDDGEVHFAKLGGLILLKMLPYRETEWRYLVFNTRTQDVRRVDAIGQSCVQLPEDHGIIFPGGYYLQTGDGKVFDTDIDDLVFLRALKSPNGEDVLYVYYHQIDGRYLLLPYNLIKKEVTHLIQCHGFTVFDDGKMLVFRSASDEPSRVHPMQVWRTPFVSAEFAARAPTDDSFLGRIGNAELVRCISDAYSVKRLAEAAEPTRQTFEDVIATIVRMKDAYYWLGAEQAGGLDASLASLQKHTELIVDEYEKVRVLQASAADALGEARAKQVDLLRDVQSSSKNQVADFLTSMTALRRQRGHVITLKDVRYIDIEALDALEAELVEAFDHVSKACVRFLLTGEAFDPLIAQIDELFEAAQGIQRSADLPPLAERLDTLNDGLNLLSEVVAGLEVEDPNQRTEILERISEVFGHLNRARATLQTRRKDVMRSEGQAEFAAQFKLLSQAVTSAIALADSPDKCDEQLSRLMVQLEELEGRFSEFDEFLGDLAEKRDEVYEAFETKKQSLLEERNRRAQNLARAADRILESMVRRVGTLSEEDDLNAYFAADPMVMKLRSLTEQLRELGDSVRADDIVARQKTAQQTALRNLRDKRDLFEDGDNLIKFGPHRFTVNTQSFELTLVPRDEGMALHLTGTDFYEPVTDETFMATEPYWSQHLVSETADVYRGEYLAACMLFDAEAGRHGLTRLALTEAAVDEAELLGKVRAYAADRYDEGYERGLHDADATKILRALLTLVDSAGDLRYGPRPRAWGSLYWAFGQDEDRARLHRRAQSLARLRAVMPHPEADDVLAKEFATAVRRFAQAEELAVSESEVSAAGRYLVDALAEPHPRFTTSREAIELKDALVSYLDVRSSRADFERDLDNLKGEPARPSSRSPQRGPRPSSRRTTSASRRRRCWKPRSSF